MNWLRALLFCALLASGGSSLRGADSPPDAVAEARALNKYLAQNGYGWTSLDLSNRNATFMNVFINGDDRRMLLDTGCSKTCLSRTGALALGLDVNGTELHSMGVGGMIGGTVGTAMVNSFKIGPYEINRSNPILVLSKSARLPMQTSGIFGLDYLVMNAAVLPVGGDLLFYKPGPHPPVDIASYMQALGFRGVPLTIVPRAGLMVAGNLDRHPFHAVVDCGCQYTTFDYKLAAGVDPAVHPIAMRLGGMDGRVHGQYGFTPGTIQVGDVALPGQLIAADKYWLLTRRGVDALIGYDVLAPHHAIIDFGHLVLWLR